MTPATLPGVATVQHILKQYHNTSGNSHVQQVLDQLKKCRTAGLGYHLYKCNNNECNQFKYQYHSCRNRHCPTCGALQKEQWIEDRKNELLPIPYYHVVFTLPHQLNSIILGNRKQLFNLLFSTASQTLLSFAHNPVHLGATPGILAVLHTWGQQLSFHPHVHCIVSGGGITETKKELQWKYATGNKNNFLFSANAMAIVYRAKFLQGLKILIANNKVTIPPGTDMKLTIQSLYNKDWVVYAKKPFGGPQQVIEYLSRYTHKVAITNNRIKAVDDVNGTVTFNYKDYADNNEQKQMQLPACEFVRRFEQHILPKYFTKIRSYGYLSNRNRKINISTILKQLKLPPHPDKIKIPWQIRLLERYHIQYNLCPHCRQQTLILVAATFKEQVIKDG